MECVEENSTNQPNYGHFVGTTIYFQKTKDSEISPLSSEEISSTKAS